MTSPESKVEPAASGPAPASAGAETTAAGGGSPSTVPAVEAGAPTTAPPSAAPEAAAGAAEEPVWKSNAIKLIYKEHGLAWTNKAQLEALAILDGQATGPWEKLSWSMVQMGAAERIYNPNAIDQASLNVCGPTVIVHALASSDPAGYATTVRKLFETGKVNGTRVCDDLLAGAVDGGMDEADWMLLSALRDSENAISDYQGKSSEDISAMTMPGEVADWMTKMLGCEKVKQLTSYLFGERKNAEEVSALLASRPNDVFVALLVDSDRMQKKSTGANVPNHWVRLMKPIVFGEDKVTMTVFTWASVKTFTYNIDQFQDTLMECVVGEKPKK